ncbi:LysM peptidoglycan-binding domain-containing protein [Streptomyces piniterrae]|uniref:LysM peptidoglycan-binding domain-containing protein n=1 Tax=Streptomyces piniterrae TaxID=2571125 RepID=A0A4U0NRG2_9ACTN|nr:transglycosylase family protein [Streptomyces piniterrae]TJZ57010.1 LysM peptidoglycan-binding domain-containing protein [Streptomyces piniterrae]
MEFPQVPEPTVRSEFRSRGVRSVTAATVLLAVGALSLAAEGTAEGASGGTWDRLAGCESGGNWQIDTGNGFSGGLQFAHSTWRSFGGGAYGTRASRATREQQIRVGERVLARQGWGAWPACSARLGLRSGSAPSATTPRRIVPRTTTPHRHTTERIRSPHFQQKQYKARPHRKTGGVIVVNNGDTLSGIATSCGWSWKNLYELNRGVIGSNPDLIFPGMRLSVRHSSGG